MDETCRQIRKEILKIAKTTGHGHIPTCFSVIEAIYAVYSVMKHDPKAPKSADRDIFILSKGHASLAQYCVLANLGYFKMEDVYSFGQLGSDFGCHADRYRIPGIEASTGSLGHGLGIGVGIALGFKIRKSPRRVFVLVGDGESNEGSIWESLLVAANLNLNNLSVIYDNNMSHERGLQIRNPAEKLKAFGCEVSEVSGHDLAELKKELARAGELPRGIVANTKKGYPSPTMMQNQYEWHRRSPTDAEFETLMRELDEKTI